MTRRAPPEEPALDAGPLFASPPRARPSDPSTSHAAAASMQSIARAQQQDLARALASAPDGLTCDEADERLGWRATSAGRRMGELVRLGSAVATDRTRRTRSGRMAAVYVASARGAA